MSVDNSCFSQCYCWLKKNTINAKEVTVATLFLSKIVYIIVRLPQEKLKDVYFPVSAIMVYV
jgi:hypothetical protein